MHKIHKTETKQKQNRTEMKTKIIIILALTTLNINLVSARNNSPKGADGPSKSDFSVSLSVLAPVTPSEATFEDATDINPAPTALSSLAPVTPKDAFLDEITSVEETNTPLSTPVDQKVETIEKGKSVHPAFPFPCDAKMGCSL